MPPPVENLKFWKIGAGRRPALLRLLVFILLTCFHQIWGPYHTYVKFCGGLVEGRCRFPIYFLYIHQKLKLLPFFNGLSKWLHICTEVRYGGEKHFRQVWRHDTDVTSRDVIWRHFQILSKKSADVSKNSTSQVTEMYFSEESFPRLKKWGVNQFSTTFRSDTMTISDFVGFCRIFDDVSKKMLTSAKNNDVTMLQVIKKLSLDVVLHFCQAVFKMAKNWLF